MSEAKKVYRYSPCPDYDIETMESWLGDMAADGLLLSCDGFLFNFGIFEKTEPKRLRYRLEPAGARATLMQECAPPEEAQELNESMGWHYVASRGNFHIYCTADPEARELHTDVHIQAMTVESVRKRILKDMVIYLLWILALIGLHVGADSNKMFLLVIGLGTPLAALVLLFAAWEIAGLFRSVWRLGQLRGRVANGALRRDKDWRRGRTRYILGQFTSLLLMFLLIAGGINGCTRRMDNSGEIPLSEFGGSLPFATMAEFLPNSSFERSDAYSWTNYVQISSDILAPVIIELAENGNITAEDGTRYSGGLDVTYIEACSEWLAEELFRELCAETNGRDRVPLEAEISGAEEYTAFAEYFPTVVLRRGNVVVRAELYNTGENELPLSLWGSALAKSIDE